MAINDKGVLVVCCRRTAAKHGWKLEGTLHQRGSKKAAVVATAPAKKLVLDLTSDKGAILKVAKKPAGKKTTVADLLK